jgi:alpha-tubulin suppressor-like RCC1 family protein
MVFSWGCNTNHQLGLFQLQEEQVDIVSEPTLNEELLAFNHIRKIKCEDDKTMILVDEPNTLLIFSRRPNIERQNKGSNERDEERKSNDDREANVEDSPE